MITFSLSARPVHEERVGGYIVFCEQDNVDTPAVHALKKFYAPLFAIIQQRAFTGRAGSIMLVSGADGERPVSLILAGMGSKSKAKNDRLEYYRRAVGAALRAAENAKVFSVALQLPEASFFEQDARVIARETAATVAMAFYHFDLFKTNPDEKKHELAVTLCVAPDVFTEAERGMEEGQRIGDAVNQARTWCDMPPAQLTPTALAQHAQRAAAGAGLKCTVFDEAQVIAMGMGGLAGVSAGSAEECRLVVMEYSCGNPSAPTIALVGKGITFDSGGLSIKPAGGMETMKDDMAGAACVISTMESLAYFKPAVNVIGITPISENLPSGTAIKPGDILKFYNGKTAEVKNTDAEGRLILADAISYAVKHYKPDSLITIATLTGSCAYALGPFFCGLMSQHEDVAERVLAASYRSGDRAWPLPFHDDYKPAIRSTIADICNIGTESYRAGAITAGFFLSNFVDNVPFVHLDVAGTAFNVPDISYYRPGATGFGVRLFINMLMNWQ